MGFLGKNDKKSDTSPRTTVIAAGTAVKGDLKLKDNLHLDGNLEGSVQSEADVAIGRSGRLKGEIRAKRVLVSGILEGKVDADRLEIVSTGQVRGEITVIELMVETGGQFIGDSQVKNDPAQKPTLKPVDSEPFSDSHSNKA